MIVHADIRTEDIVEVLAFRLRHWPDVDLVYYLKSNTSLLIFAATQDAKACEALAIRISQLNGVEKINSHFAFPIIKTLSSTV